MSDTSRRRLLVMRHAKSSWKSGAATDHARPLNKRGREAAPLMAEMLRALDRCPEAVISSDAQRARQTWAGCATVLPEPALLRFSPTLYFSPLDEILRELATAPGEHRTLLAIGHNPGWEALVTWLCGAQVIMKTANIALLEAELSSWKAGFVAPRSWMLSRVLRPR